MIEEQIAQKVLAAIGLKHQEALTKATLNLTRARANQNYLQMDRECRKLVLQIANCKNEKKDTSNLEQEFRTLLVKRNNVLLQMGLSPENLKPEFACKKCEDSGFFDGKYCSCFIKMYNEELMKKSGLEFNKIPALCDYNFGVFQGENLINVKKIINVSEVFVNNFDNLKIRNMLLMGSVGVGKTYLSKIIAKEVFKKNKSVLFISAFSLFNSLGEVTFKNHEKAKYLDYLTNIDLLVIDDLGAQNINKILLQDLLALINERVENKKSTIITTNLNHIDIKNNFGERLFSRLNDKREFIVVNLLGKDLRIE